MNPKFFLIMGVAGCGKTTIGKALACRLGWNFYDADDFHPLVNIDKMTDGIPLNDSDRLQWLVLLHDLISSCLKAARPGILACSTLKESYPQTLVAGNDDVQIVYLKGSYELIQSRMAARDSHYMKADMLRSQFNTLEEPVDALTIDFRIR